MIRMAGQLHNTERVEMELTIRMSLADWALFVEQLSQKHPSWEVAAKINRVVGTMTAQVTDRHEDVQI